MRKEQTIYCLLIFQGNPKNEVSLEMLIRLEILGMIFE